MLRAVEEKVLRARWAELEVSRRENMRAGRQEVRTRLGERWEEEEEEGRHPRRRRRSPRPQPRLLSAASLLLLQLDSYLAFRLEPAYGPDRRSRPLPLARLVLGLSPHASARRRTQEGRRSTVQAAEPLHQVRPRPSTARQPAPSSQRPALRLAASEPRRKLTFARPLDRSDGSFLSKFKKPLSPEEQEKQDREAAIARCVVPLLVLVHPHLPLSRLHLILSRSLDIADRLSEHVR